MDTSTTPAPTFDEYGPKAADECHYGACHDPATDTLAEVPYCERHFLARLALRARLNARDHGHGLNTIAGYRVVETDPHGNLPAEVVATYDSPTSYGTALAVADVIRRSQTRGWAVIDTHYACGCWSDEREGIDR